MNRSEETVWMIRRDGAAIPCIHHIYTGDEDIDETLYAAEWLYQNTLFEHTKILCLRLIKSYSVTLGRVDFISALLDDVADKPYIFLTSDFVQDLKAVDTGDVFRLCNEVKNALNEEFLRARYGGMYNTKKGCNDMYFRISSYNFNWENIIYKFVDKHSDIIKSVTVVYDEESTGFIDKLYEFRNGKTYKKSSVEEFKTGNRTD